MTASPEIDLRADLVARARAHGLELDPATLRMEEAGLDYRVAFARDRAGRAWVLRVPRRPDVAAKLGEEAAILDFVRPRLSVAVPQWTIRASDLIAYPLLPGEPGLTLGPGGELRWKLDLASPRYADAFGALLAELHRIDPAEARAAGLIVQTADEVRRQWRADLETVRAEFEIAPALLERWRGWLDDDACWPSFSVFTHGELYPAHVLIDEGDRITGVLDWTTAKVADPGRDFVFQHAMTSPETFARTVASYERAGGRVWPRLADHCGHLWSASPIAYALYALLTGAPEHRAAAASQLAPPAR